MKEQNPTVLMKELLNEDRFEYLKMIRDSRSGTRSMDITQKIMESPEITEEVKTENIVVNKRLRKLVNLGILISEEEKYKLSGLGYLLMDSWNSIIEKVDTMKKFPDFFDTHFVDDIPKEFFRQMYKLQDAELTQNAPEWMNMVEKQMGKVERKVYSVADKLHTYSDSIIEKRKNREIEIVIIYQFSNYPELNYPDEKPLFDKLKNAGAEFRYTILESKHPIGIRIVDEKWATFLLSRMSDGKLDREHVFYGENPGFVSWCRDLMYHLWSFEAKPLNPEEVTAKDEK